jgi:hypothetical protein
MTKTRTDSELFERAILRSGRGGSILDFSGEFFLVGKGELALRYVSFWLAHPGVLPCHRNALIISAESHICAVAIARLN